MNTLTKQEKIKSVAKHWKKQYFKNGVWGPSKHGFEAIYNQLKQLGPTATEDEIEAIIGNRTWTQNKCDECDKDSDVVIMLTESSEYVTYVCLDCLRAAITLCENAINANHQPF